MRRVVEFATGLSLALALFVGPVFVIAMLIFGVLLWASIVYIAAWTIAMGLLFAIPAWILARLAFSLHGRTWFGALLFFLAGGIAALAAVLTLGGSAVLPFGASALNGTIIVSVYAAICSCLGWLAVRRHSTPTRYEDALDGLDFEQLVALAAKRP